MCERHDTVPPTVFCGVILASFVGFRSLMGSYWATVVVQGIVHFMLEGGIGLGKGFRPERNRPG